jgi:CRP-like cAMP-binding protein
MKRHYKRPLSERIAILQSAYPFQELQPTEAARLLEGACLCECERNEEIVREGELGNTFYIVARGRLTVTRNEEPLDGRERGDFFGEMAVLTETPRFATVTAATPCTLLEISKASLEDCIREHPTIALRIMATLIRRQQSLDQKRVEANAPVIQRLAAHLLEQANAESNIVPLVDQPYLARSLRTSRETVNRILAVLRRADIIQMSTEAPPERNLSTNKLYIADRARLTSIAQGEPFYYRASSDKKERQNPPGSRGKME